MFQLALVFIGTDDVTYVGIFNPEGDIEQFVPFVSDKPFEGISKDQFAICEYGSSDVSDFTLNMIAQIQLSLREDLDASTSAQAFVEDQEKGPNAYKIIYKHALEGLGVEPEHKYTFQVDPKILH